MGELSACGEDSPPPSKSTVPENSVTVSDEQLNAGLVVQSPVDSQHCKASMRAASQHGEPRYSQRANRASQDDLNIPDSLKLKVDDTSVCRRESMDDSHIETLHCAFENGMNLETHCDMEGQFCGCNKKMHRAKSDSCSNELVEQDNGCSKDPFSQGDSRSTVIPDLVPKFYSRFDLVRYYRRTKSLYGASPNFKFGPKASIMKSQAAVLTIQDPGSQRLTWYKAPLTVLIIKKIFDPAVIPPFLELTTWLIQEKQMVVYVEAKSLEDPQLNQHSNFEEIRSKLCTFKEEQDDLTDKIDFIICLGGDGTLLYASSLFQQSVPPVMALNLGSLGFLTPFKFDEFRDQVTQVLEGNAALTLRTRLKCGLCRSTDQICHPVKNVESKRHILVLNEVVVDRGPSPWLCHIDLYIEHKYITSVQGDGLIISTPTGSTAYAAAAGASIIHPNVPAILITPICPHSLSFRPIVVPAGVEIKIMVSPDARGTAWASFDGRNRQEIQKGDTLRISTSIYPVPSLCCGDQISDWFESLASCLHWNVRKQQRAFHTSPEVSSSESLLSIERNDRNDHVFHQCVD